MKVFIPDGIESIGKEADLLVKERECAKCGAGLTDKDVMKIQKEDGSWEEIPLPVCPDCFKKQMREQVRKKSPKKVF